VAQIVEAHLLQIDSPACGLQMTPKPPISIEQSTATRRALYDRWSVAADPSSLTAEEVVENIRYSRPRRWALHCCPRRGRPHRSAESGSREEQAESLWAAAAALWWESL
jgi:hypothetical protein